MKKKILLSRFNSASALLSNLIAYYKFDTNSIDSTANAHNGTDTAITYSSSSANFNGSTSKISIAQSTNFDFSNATNDLPFSMNFWFKSNNITLTQTFLVKRDDTIAAQYQIILNGSRVFVALFKDLSNILIIHSNTVLSSGVDYNVCVTYNGNGLTSGVKIYIDGALTTSTLTTIGTYTKMPISSQPAVFGNLIANPITLNGYMNRFGIWKNRELTAGETTQLYNSGSGIIYPF
jgi:hypothetical protein